MKRTMRLVLTLVMATLLLAVLAVSVSAADDYIMIGNQTVNSGEYVTVSDSGVVTTSTTAPAVTSNYAYYENGTLELYSVDWDIESYDGISSSDDLVIEVNGTCDISVIGTFAIYAWYELDIITEPNTTGSLSVSVTEADGNYNDIYAIYAEYIGVTNTMLNVSAGSSECCAYVIYADECFVAIGSDIEIVTGNTNTDCYGIYAGGDDYYYDEDAYGDNYYSFIADNTDITVTVGTGYYESDAIYVDDYDALITNGSLIDLSVAIDVDSDYEAYEYQCLYGIYADYCNVFIEASEVYVETGSADYVNYGIYAYGYIRSVDSTIDVNIGHAKYYNCGIYSYGEYYYDDENGDYLDIEDIYDYALIFDNSSVNVTVENADGESDGIVLSYYDYEYDIIVCNGSVINVSVAADEDSEYDSPEYIYGFSSNGSIFVVDSELNVLVGSSDYENFGICSEGYFDLAGSAKVTSKAPVTAVYAYDDIYFYETYDDNGDPKYPTLVMYGDGQETVDGIVKWYYEVDESTVYAYVGDDADNTETYVDYEIDDLDLYEYKYVKISAGHEHIWSEEWSYSTIYHWHICEEEDCYITDASDMDGYGYHTGEWIIAKYPTYYKNGLARYICTECGYVMNEVVIPAESLVSPDGETDVYITAETNEGGTITDLGTVKVTHGGTAVYTITPDEGYGIEAVYVDGNDVGAVTEYTFNNVTSNHTITVVFYELPWENPFIDVSEDDEFYAAVEFVYELGLFEGTSEYTFDPDLTMTRGMFVTVLGRLAGVDVSAYTELAFSDVVAGAYYAPYVAWAAENGIINGITPDTFGVNDEITVEQAVTIMARFAAYLGIDTSSDITLAYEDADEVDGWAMAAMKWAVETGLYTGEDGKLDPNAPASRALVAEIMYNFVVLFIEA